MTDEQINQHIAEACGWYFMDDSWHYPNGANAITTPDYLNDLNAMHEAEKMLSMVSGYHENGGYGLYIVALENNVSATARQRAEAFLRTIGKWEEEA